MEATAGDLSIVEVAKLENHELTIQAGLKSFVDVGRALMEIRDGRLYRTTHMNFESYCQERWGMTRQRAHQLIDSSEVVATVSTVVDILPQTEREARPLAKLEPEDQIEAWKEAVETAPDGVVTAAHVEAVVAAKLEEIAEEDTVIEEPEVQPKGGSIKAKTAARFADKLKNAAQESRDWFVPLVDKVCDGGVHTMESLQKIMSNRKADVIWFIRMCDISPLVTVHRTKGKKTTIQYSFVKNESSDAQQQMLKLAKRIVDDPTNTGKVAKAAKEIVSLLGG